MSQHNQSNDFGKWLRSRRRDLGLDEEEMAGRLDVSIGTYIMWEAGKTPWAVLTLEYKSNIEMVCGKFVGDPSLAFPETRVPDPGTISLRDNPLNPEIIKELDEIIRETESSADEEPASRTEAVLVTKAVRVNEADAIEFHCKSCRAPILLSHNGRCPACGRAGDPSA